jgi:hypothetical protein
MTSTTTAAKKDPTQAAPSAHGILKARLFQAARIHTPVLAPSSQNKTGTDACRTHFPTLGDIGHSSLFAPCGGDLPFG